VFRENVAGNAENKYFENGLLDNQSSRTQEDRGEASESELTSNTVTTRDQYGAPIQRTRVWGCGVEMEIVVKEREA